MTLSQLRELQIALRNLDERASSYWTGTQKSLGKVISRAGQTDSPEARKELVGLSFSLIADCKRLSRKAICVVICANSPQEIPDSVLREARNEADSIIAYGIIGNNMLWQDDAVCLAVSEIFDEIIGQDALDYGDADLRQMRSQADNN